MESREPRIRKKDQAVFYDLLPMLEEPHVISTLCAKGRRVHSACRLSWTPRDISLSAWKLTGPDLKDLNGALVRDPKRKSPIFIMSLQQYHTVRTGQHTKWCGKRNLNSPQLGTGKRWKSTYVNVVKGGDSQNNVNNKCCA